MSLKSDIDERMKGLILDQVDLILVTDIYLMNRLQKMKFKGIKSPIQLMLVNDLGDLKALSIQDMRAAGWVQEHKVKAKMEELEEYKAKYEALCK